MNKQTKQKLYRYFYFTIALGVLCLMILVIQRIRIDYQDRENTIALINELRHLDTQLNENVLKTQGDLTNNYDPLVNNLDSIIYYRQLLLKYEKNTDNQSTHLQHLAQTLDFLFSEKEMLVERFKTYKSIVSNSLHSMPLVMEELREKPIPTSLKSQLRIFEKECLMFYVNSNLTLYQQLSDQIKTFKQTVLNSKENQAILLLAINHAQNIIDHKTTLDQVTTELLAVTTQSIIDDFSDELELAFNQKVRTNQLYTYLIFGVAVLLLGLVILAMLRMNKQRESLAFANQRLQRLNTKVADRNQELSQTLDQLNLTQHQLIYKNQQINASLSYAKRIQDALLPSQKKLTKLLGNSFVFYQPKDLVSGDFFWIEQQGDHILFAVADCTGHGVPGALMSVICHHALKRAVREYRLVEPHLILNETREIVINELGQQEERLAVSDGMDIALCTLKGNELSYAGAYNPIWICRGGEVLKVKANRQPIGKYRKPTPFTPHTFELAKGDTIYLFTDGFIDQFGGNHEKKFKSANLEKLLKSIQSESMEQQGKLIAAAFDEWKGELQQVDDVCIVGLKIS